MVSSKGCFYTTSCILPEDDVRAVQMRTTLHGILQASFHSPMGNESVNQTIVFTVLQRFGDYYIVSNCHDGYRQIILSLFLGFI